MKKRASAYDEIFTKETFTSMDSACAVVTHWGYWCVAGGAGLGSRAGIAQGED